MEEQPQPLEKETAEINGRDKRKQNTQAKGCYCIFIPAYGISRFCIYLYFAEKLQRKYTGIGCRMEYSVRRCHS